MYPNGLNAYKNNSVNYASKEQLLLMLVDGAVRFSRQAEEALINKDMKKVHECLVKTQDIFTELMVTLDTSATDWGNQLFNIYAFIKEKLVEANLKKDIKILQEIIPVIKEVRDMWYEVDKKVKNTR